MTSRHRWSATAKDLFFGPEPCGDDRLQAHTAAVASYRAFLVDAHAASSRAVSSDPTTREFLDLLAEVAITEAPASARPMRVVLMGRTMAGKSTLLAALTDGSKDRIGVGAQRTSRDVFGAPAVDIADVEIVDTPGVGAQDGAEDVALAMAEIPGADLVLWVASNDSFQEETAQALREVAFRGKPVVIALNCRAPLVDDLDREDFLDDPAAVFDQHEGHFATIRNHLATAGVRPVAEIMLHAEAARQSRTADAVGTELGAASRVADLLGVLRSEAEARRAHRRVLREADEVRAQALQLTEALSTVEASTRASVEVARGMRQDQERRIARLVSSCEQTMADNIVRIVGKRRGWHQSVTDFGPQVVTAWETEQGDMLDEIEQDMKSQLSQLSHTMAGEIADANREWTTAERPGIKVGGLQDFRSVWKRRAAGLAVGGGGALAIAVVGFVYGGPVGAVVGIIGGLAITPLRKRVQSLFTSKAKILEANRELLRTQIGDVLDQVEAKMLASVRATIAQVRDDIAQCFARNARAEASASAVADGLASRRREVRAATSTLDHETAVCLLHLEDRPRLAGAVRKVTRLAGVCTVVEVDEEALSEAWLFPPASPELVAYGRPPEPGRQGVRAASYVLGLTEHVPEVRVSRSDCTRVTTAEKVPDPVLAAWSANLSDHLETPVEISHTSTRRSATP
ncbi:GTPase domain-containing protein [Demequina rhizosphaerae]|uniref:GTPase domain-containing protein n=1 Tax=Demequina rhizosphaerae TaxID=1638985 RepID=UPI000783F89F|nr:GTPase domain-containing protein [Demequina rhizosphaerae]